MPEPPNPNPTASEKLLDAASRLFAPLVRLLIARGVTFQVAQELLKRAYVRAAAKHFVEGDEATGTRLSLLTGLNRKEIKRLTDEGTPPKTHAMASYAGAVYEVWRTQPQWQGADTKPRVLPRRSAADDVSFDGLVRSVTTDHRPAALLDEMVRLGIVTPVGEHDVKLNEQAFVPKQTFDDQLIQLADSVEDHLSAAVVNVLSDAPVFLERNVYSDELSEASAAQLHDEARKHWKSLHEDVVKKAIAAEDSDRKSGLPTRSRVRVGMYFYTETDYKE
jgi:Family of unknown function (DUF6502)